MSIRTTKTLDAHLLKHSPSVIDKYYILVADVVAQTNPVINGYYRHTIYIDQIMAFRDGSWILPDEEEDCFGKTCFYPCLVFTKTHKNPKWIYENNLKIKDLSNDMKKFLEQDARRKKTLTARKVEKIAKWAQAYIEQYIDPLLEC